MAICAAPAAIVGCSSQPATPPAAKPGLQPLAVPQGGSSADAQRAALARFIGVWEFEGWSIDDSGSRRTVSGRAAGIIEREHFVLIDLQATSGELAGRAFRRGGSILLASEPGIGVTLTIWGDASPSVGRLTGTAGEGGGAFQFTEARTPPGQQRVSMSIVFNTNDHWTAELRNAQTSSAELVASYQFKRAAN